MAAPTSKNYARQWLYDAIRERMTIAQFARVVGVAPSTVWRWIAGENTPLRGSDERNGIAAALGWDLARLDRKFTGECPHDEGASAGRQRAVAEIAVDESDPERQSSIVVTERPTRATFSPYDSVASPLDEEGQLFDFAELGQMALASDLGVGAIDGIAQSTYLLCRAYPCTPGPMLLERTRARLGHVMHLLGKRVRLTEHRELLVQGGWLAALLACVHYDLGHPLSAEAARHLALRLGNEAGHGELLAWAFEMRAWFALVEGRHADLIQAAQEGQSVAAPGNAMAQLILQEAKGHAYVGGRFAALDALDRASATLARLATPEHPEHHFVFDHAKWIFYASTVHALLEDDIRAEEYAKEILARHTQPDGSTRHPMRVAGARIDLALVHARRGDLEGAVVEGTGSFAYERCSLADLVSRAEELAKVLHMRFPGERKADDFHQRLTEARRVLLEGEA